MATSGALHYFLSSDDLAGYYPVEATATPDWTATVDACASAIYEALTAAYPSYDVIVSVDALGVAPFCHALTYDEGSFTAIIPVAEDVLRGRAYWVDEAGKSIAVPTPTPSPERERVAVDPIPWYAHRLAAPSWYRDAITRQVLES